MGGVRKCNGGKIIYKSIWVIMKYFIKVIRNNNINCYIILYLLYKVRYKIIYSSNDWS